MGDVMKGRQVSGTDARDQAARPAGSAGPAQVTDGPAETRTPQLTVGDRAETAGDPARGGAALPLWRVAHDTSRTAIVKRMSSGRRRMSTRGPRRESMQ